MCDGDAWVERLRPGHPRREQTVAALREALLRVARHELSRRRGPEELAQPAAEDALGTILGRLDEYCGRSRFTTWAYKFVIFEISARLALIA
jgi:RNA polymerase sigma-70 factor (ECF subfamily)